MNLAGPSIEATALTPFPDDLVLAFRHFRLSSSVKRTSGERRSFPRQAKGRRDLPDGLFDMVSGRKSPARKTLKSLAFHPPNGLDRPLC